MTVSDLAFNTYTVEECASSATVNEPVNIFLLMMSLIFLSIETPGPLKNTTGLFYGNLFELF